jgi:AmiR/NasT family two-component response regulator
VLVADSPDDRRVPVDGHVLVARDQLVAREQLQLAAEVVRLEAVVAALQDENSQLRGALESRVLIEQAKGILAERFALDLEAAFELLHGAARNSRRPLRTIARAVIESPRTPAEVARLRAGG